MKKIIGAIGGVLVVIMGISFAGLAHAANPTVTIGSQSASNGAAISVPVTASNFGGIVQGMDIYAHFNPALLTYTGVTIGSAFNGYSAPTTNNNTSTNSFSLNWFDSRPLAIDSGTLFTINFTVATSAVTTANLTFSPAPDLDSSSTVLTGTFIPGAITLNPPTPNATLSGMTVSQGTLAPTFSSGTNSYTASVANAVTSMTITPTAAQGASSTITVNGTTTASGAASGAINLNVGSNIITVFVTAYDGLTTDTYTITVIRPASSDASLSGMTVSQGTLAPTFASSTTSYTESVAYAVTSMTVTPTAAQGASSTITVNGTTVASGATSGAINLNVGSNTITVYTTAPDGSTHQTYTITVTRAPFPDSSLSAMTVSAGTLTPAFASGTNAYTANVMNSVTSMTLTPTATQGASSTITVNGTTTASGAASGAINLSVGSNTVTVHVTAYDSIASSTYTVIVTRVAVPSTPGSFAIGTSTTSTAPLSWTASTPNNGAAISFYSIYRGLSSSTISGTPVATTTSVNYTTTGMAASTTYYFYVTAQDNVGNVSASSTIASTTTQTSLLPSIPSFTASPTIIAPGSTSTLSWTVTSAASTTISISPTIGTVTGASTTTPALAATTLYTLTATNLNGSTVATTTVYVPTAPTAPGNFTVGSPTTSTLSLSWATSTPNNGATIVYYSIYRGLSAGTISGTPIATTTNLSYTNTALSLSTSYFYYVTAKDSVGNISASSSIISGTTGPSIASFVPAATSTALIVPISAFTTNGPAAGYFVSQSSTTPSSTNPNWVVSVPTSYTFSQGTASAVLYAWVKDSAADISPVVSTTVSFPYYLLPSTSTVQVLTASNIVTSTATSSSVTSSTAILFNYPVDVTIGTATVSILASTTMTTATTSDFTAITATTTVSTTDLPSNSGVAGTVQYGFATTSITLSQPVAITIPVDPSYNGLTLTVYQSEDGGVTWISLTTCVAANNICLFYTPTLSSFAVVAPVVVTPPPVVSSGGSSGGGGGGGGYYTPITTGGDTSGTGTSIVTAGMTVTQLQALLASLIAQLNALEAQAGMSGGSYAYTRDLHLGMTGADVTQLQLLLIAKNVGTAAQKLGALGRTTTYFGVLTQNALAEFQKSVGITPASGYFGSITRAWVASH